MNLPQTSSKNHPQSKVLKKRRRRSPGPDLDHVLSPGQGHGHIHLLIPDLGGTTGRAPGPIHRGGAQAQGEGRLLAGEVLPDALHLLLGTGEVEPQSEEDAIHQLLYLAAVRLPLPHVQRHRLLQRNHQSEFHQVLLVSLAGLLLAALLEGGTGHLHLLAPLKKDADLPHLSNPVVKGKVEARCLQDQNTKS